MPKTHIICLTLFSLRYFSKNINRFMFNEFFLMCFHCSWAGLLSIAPLKKVLPFAFFFKIYQAFKSREGTFSQTNIAEWFKIGHGMSRNKQKYE